MKQFQINKDNYQASMLDVWNHVIHLLKIGGLKVTVESDEGIGKWGMTRTWRSWMGSTAKFMAQNGVTMPLMLKKSGEQYGSRPFNSQDAHELFTSQWMGLDNQGNRLSWAKDSDHKADKGQRFSAMLKHEQWMLERGITYLVPKNGEFFKEKEKSES